MPKLMLINVTHSEESRVGIVNDGVLDGFEIESLSREHLKGNIYKGVVHRIHPALEAAFVDIGGDRDAFLPLDEICFKNLPHPPQVNGGDEGPNGRRRPRIRDILRNGDEILVQIAKEPYGNKPPTLTTFYSLPGRYLVLLPGSDEAGISRRIEGDERTRLRKLISDLNPPDGYGVIVRTAAGFDHDTGELARDLAYLQRIWEKARHVAEQRRAPALIYREHDIVLRTIRDFFTPDIDEIYIDNEEVFQRARDFLQSVMPGKEHVLHLYRGEQPIFSAFDVEAQFETIFKRRVSLRSGGSIVIDSTEALTAVDVNSGGSVRSANPEETAFRTNMEAAAEISRQLRLRDIGGLIVVDFIDMREPAHIQEVERAMRDGMRPDKARHELGRISRFGLIEISRQRLRPAATATTYTSCPMCEGHGAVRTTESAALVALRKIHNRVAAGDVQEMRVNLPTQVALYLLNQKREDLSQLEERYRTRILLNLSEKLMAHQIELDVRVRPVTEPAAAIGPVAAAPAQSAAPAPAPAGQAAHSGSGDGKKKRRRGRRKSKTLRAAIALGAALSSLGGPASAAPTSTEPPSSPAPEHPPAAPPPAPSTAQRTDSRPDQEATSGRRGRRRGGRGGRSRRAAVAMAEGLSAPGSSASAAGPPSSARVRPEAEAPTAAPTAPPPAAASVPAAPEPSAAPDATAKPRPARARRPSTREKAAPAEKPVVRTASPRARKTTAAAPARGRKTVTEESPTRSATSRARTPRRKKEPPAE